MATYTVYKEQLPKLFEKWNESNTLYVPAKLREGFYDLVPWKKDLEITWDFDVVYNSPKRFLFPPRETLITLNRKICEAAPVFEAPPQIFFGVHPYDVKANNQLDQLLESGAPDQNYVRRREATVIMAYEPLTVSPTAFWASVVAATAASGFDLYWTKIGPSVFTVEVGSARGKELLTMGGDLLPATAGDKEGAQRANACVLFKAHHNGLCYNGEETPRLLVKCWDSPLWRRYSQMCLACGSCNLVCPTCSTVSTSARRPTTSWSEACATASGKAACWRALPTWRATTTPAPRPRTATSVAFFFVPRLVCLNDPQNTLLCVRVTLIQHAEIKECFPCTPKGGRN